MNVSIFILEGKTELSYMISKVASSLIRTKRKVACFKISALKTLTQLDRLSTSTSTLRPADFYLLFAICVWILQNVRVKRK